MKKVLIGSSIFLMAFLALRASWIQNGQPGTSPFSVSLPWQQLATDKPENSPGKDGQGQENQTQSLLEQYGLLEAKTIFLLNGTIIAQGAGINVLGQGFAPKEEIQFSLRGTAIADTKQIQTLVADENGNFGAGMPLPGDIPPGRYTLQALGSISGKTSTTEFELKAGLPWVEPSLWAGKALSYVSFNGHGFRQGETVEVFFDSLAGDPVYTFAADKHGDFEVPAAMVPLTTGGQHAFLFVGQAGQVPVRIPFSVVTFNPWATLNPYTVKQEELVSVSIQDFAPMENVRVYFNKISGKPLAVLTADESGGSIQEKAFSVPLGSTGTNTLYFVGESSFLVAPVEFEVIPFTPGLELAEYAGVPGTAIALKGEGFARNETVHAFFGSNQDKKEMSVFQTDENGKFDQSGRFTVPFRLYHKSQPVTAVGDKSKVPVEVVFEVLEFNPWLGLNAYNGPPGFSLTFVAGGFAKNETVTIHKGDASSALIATSITDEQGNFAEVGPFQVPLEARGRISFTALGASSGVEAKVTFEIAEEQAAATPEAKN